MNSSLTGQIRCDVLVVGGGMAGLMTAYKLKQDGINCIVCEAETVGSGISKNTTGKVTAQHGLCYQSLIKNLGDAAARKYLRVNLDAVERFRAICQEEGCMFETKNSYVYSLHDRIKLENEQAALARIGYKAKIQNKLPLPFDFAGAIEFENQGQIDACEVMKKLGSKLRVFEHTPVRHISGGKAYTDNAVILADKIIVTTHFPIINKYGLYFAKMHQEREYFLAAENCENVEGMYVSDGGGLSLRNMGDLLYVGGAAHRTGKPGVGWTPAEDFIKKYYPYAKIKFKWATQDCITLDGMPYIGKYSRFVPNLYVVTGFNKWGMSMSAAAAEIISDTVQGRENSCASLFYPHRGMLHRRLFTNLRETAAGILNFKVKRCPHLGCALVWNKNEKTWDCPCHGSRFTADGDLIDNPAQRGMKQR